MFTKLRNRLDYTFHGHVAQEQRNTEHWNTGTSQNIMEHSGIPKKTRNTHKNPRTPHKTRKSAQSKKKTIK